MNEKIKIKPLFNKTHIFALLYLQVVYNGCTLLCLSRVWDGNLIHEIIPFQILNKDSII